MGGVASRLPPAGSLARSRRSHSTSSNHVIHRFGRPQELWRGVHSSTRRVGFAAVGLNELNEAVSSEFQNETELNYEQSSDLLECVTRIAENPAVQDAIFSCPALRGLEESLMSQIEPRDDLAVHPIRAAAAAAAAAENSTGGNAGFGADVPTDFWVPLVSLCNSCKNVLQTSEPVRSTPSSSSSPVDSQHVGNPPSNSSSVSSSIGKVSASSSAMSAVRANLKDLILGLVVVVIIAGVVKKYSLPFAKSFLKTSFRHFLRLSKPVAESLQPE
eukprot:TRINITY_DN1952_c2_g5_i1.p1 TRINITY_DN1952_c2_g5~~TRINITY_DN1952_c2_g5_i1.p1  ORF type:complete len:273 (-),score=37.56 TRINITY_DN1952_c2_g5_i1:76-894(-)